MYDLRETQLIREALDQITVRGADAKFVAQLQIKLENQLQKLATPPKAKS
jgi:hypothetical protein